VTKENILDKIKARLNDGDIIGKQAYHKVVTIITKLRSDLTAARSGSNAAIARSEASVAAAEAATKDAKDAQQKAAEAAEEAEKMLNTELLKLKAGENLSSGKIEELQNLMSDAKAKAESEVTTLTARISELEKATKQLETEKTEAEGKYVQLFNDALTTIDEALSDKAVNDLIGEQAGGFQSSSSGNYDYKKYRSSSRSYSNKIKGLKKKRKQSKKERKQSKKRRRDRKKKSKHNKTRKH